jgi:hypothetical protein
MSDIESHRNWIREQVAQGRLLPDEGENELSPDGCYRLEIVVYTWPNGYGCIATIYDQRDDSPIAVLYRDDDRFWHAWVSQGGTQYLVCSESLEGQTVVDLTHRKVASVLCENDPFIWTEYHLSPDAEKLAVIGCYWACPYMVTVYDFRHPMSLPMPTLAQFNNAQFRGWINSLTLAVVTESGEEAIFQIPE